jgi:DNA-binding transcriptional ArsR family regulator
VALVIPDREARLHAALAHPIRVKAYRVLCEREASSKEIAETIGANIGNVAYHVRRMAELGLLKLVREEPARGAVKHFYRAKPVVWP